VDGLAEGCRAFNTPVTGGNVSLYNQSPAGAIDPTPTIGMVGLIDDPKHITRSHFEKAGDAIILIGGLGDELGASHYLKVVHGKKAGCVPKLDFTKEIAVQDGVRALIKSRLIKSAHDCSEGGLAVTLAESCISGDHTIGAEIDFGATGLRPEQLLFNESQSRIVISVAANNAAAVLSLLEWRGVRARRVGTVGGQALVIRADGASLNWPVAELHKAWYFAIQSAMSES
jgi:phosphoribosylformylglycinamidine synthase